MPEIKVPSGAKVVINAAPFIDAEDLKDSILQEVSRRGLDLRLNLEKGKDQDIDFGGLISAALAVVASKEVRKALNKCLIRCTYNGEKITEATFEPVDRRKDYHDIQIACVKENVGPFFDGLVSKLKPLVPLALAQARSQTESSPK